MEVSLTFEQRGPRAWHVIAWRGDQRYLELYYDGDRDGARQMMEYWVRTKQEAEHGRADVQV